MQYYVPYKPVKKVSKVQIKSVIAVFLFFILFLSVLIGLGVSRKQNKCFDRFVYNFVYVQKTRTDSNKTEKDNLKNMGGAGVFLFHKQHYLLVANVYTKLDDANEIKNGMIETFEKADVLTLEINPLPRKLQNKIRQNDTFYKYFKFLLNISKDIEQLNMNYVTGKKGQGKVMSEILARKLELESIIKEFVITEEEKLFEDIKTYANMHLLHFENFFNDFYGSTKKQSLLCELCVNLALTRVDLFDNLANKGK